MEARLASLALVVASLLSLGASSRSQNFLVDAPTPQLASQIAQSAEIYRRDLAIEWLGHELPPWHDVCPIRVQVGPHLGAGGATSFMFDRGRPFGWRMDIQGPEDRLLDSVLPHEVTHMIFATHFGRPLPRWADEGACTSVEHPSEKGKQEHLLVSFLTTGRGIAFNKMFAMKEYPADILPLYSQGYSLARFLINQGGKQKFIRYVGDGMGWNNWTAATRTHYGYASLSDLQVTWLDWVRRGCPQEATQPPMLAQGSPPQDIARTEAQPARSLAPPVSLASNAAPFDSWYARQASLSRRPDPGDTSSSPADSSNADPPPLPNSTARSPGLGEPEPLWIPPAPHETTAAEATLIGSPPPRVPLPLYQALEPSGARRS